MNRILWISLSFAIALGAIWQFFPLPDAQKRLNTLPLSGSQFHGKEIPLTPFEKQALPKVNIVKRLYTVDTTSLFITILDGTHNRHGVHDPLYCFRGAGWQLISKKQLPLPQGHAQLLKLSKGKRKKEALVWFSNGSIRYPAPFDYWVQTTLRRLTLGLSSPEPVLVIIQPTHQDPVDWSKVLHDFSPILDI